jgi:hypothetical protein
MYKIKKILYAETREDREEEYYRTRIGMIVDLDETYFKVGKFLLLKYIVDENHKLYGCYLKSSTIKSISDTLGLLRVETRNSIYELEPVIALD